MTGVLVVTGGSRGIGAAVCRLAAARGYDVVVNYAADSAAAQDVVGGLTNVRAVAVGGDVSDAGDVTRLFDAATSLGPLVGLVNNAGITGNTPGRLDVSSTAAHRGSPGEWVPYAASKAAVETMTLGLAKEVAAEGIRVNAVAPGLVHTDLHAAAGMPDRPDRIAPMIPMGRAGQPNEIAEGIVWLLSPAASFVTGAVLPISGGF
jgi:NAD(P)-dependent dehydrogenase (short-subunit alcohol dehydrogenase family)